MQDCVNSYEMRHLLQNRFLVVIYKIINCNNFWCLIMKIQSNLKITTALALALYVNHANAMELEVYDEKAIIHSVTNTNAVTNTNDLAIEPITKAPSATFLGIEEEIKIYHDMRNAVRNLLSPEFRDALNNVLTWIAYNESKRLYTQHSDQFLKPLADTLIDININLIQHLVLRTVGLKDVIKATNILTNGALTLDQKPSAYIRQEFSEQFRDWCRLKPLTDAINEKLIAPYLVGPSAAYAIHEADIAGLMQEHLFSKAEELIEAQKPRLLQIASKKLDELEARKESVALKIEDLKQRLDTWEDSEKVVNLKAERDEIYRKLCAKAEERDAQQLVVNDEVNKMTRLEWWKNCLPGTSTDNQIKLTNLQSQLSDHTSAYRNKNNEIAAVKRALESDLHGQNMRTWRTEDKIKKLTNAVQLIEQPADGAQSSTINLIGDLINGARGKRSKKWVQEKTALLEQYKTQLAKIENLSQSSKNLSIELKHTSKDEIVCLTERVERFKKEKESEIRDLQEELDEENESPNDSYFQIALAGMTWQQAAQPCPHIEYGHIQWVGKRLRGQEIAVYQENQLSNEILKGMGNFALTSGSIYLELTGVTGAASKAQNSLSLETMTNKKDELIGMLTEGQATHKELSEIRKDVMESEGTGRLTKTFYCVTTLAQQGWNIYSTGQNTLSTVKSYAEEVSDNVTSLGNTVRSAARPITVLANGIKRYPVVWAVSYMGSCVLDTSMPYCSVIALGLGAMDDYGMWEPLADQLSRTKNALFSRCCGEKEHID